jgi:hypothetical protein
MNLIRATISVFIVLLLVSVAAGWEWTSAHQPARLATASHLVLGLSAAAGVLGLVMIWVRRPDRRVR